MTFFLHQRQACRFAAVFLMLAIELEAFGPMAEERRINALPTDPGADIFAASAPVLRFKIEIGETNLQSLRKEPRKYVPATVREGGLIYTNVGVHLKGAAGSFRSIDDKAALTLSFGKLSPRQRFHGLQKIHLNNSVQDVSYLTELLCGELFLAAGVPAARTTHARVYLNGRDLGLYVLKEGFDKTFLRRTRPP